MGWAGPRNGELLRQLEGRFDMFVTQDQNIAHQNTIAPRPFGVFVLRTKGGRWRELEPLMPRLREAIASIRHGTVAVIGA